MKKQTVSSLMLGLMIGGSSLQCVAGEPKIVVGIVVDQLRTDYIEQLRPYFGTRGFNRLAAEGVYFPDVDFRNTVSDASAGTALVYTGAWPAFNGVASEEMLDQVMKRNVPVLATDPQKPKTDYSPENLRLSTIADELFINSGSLSKIYSVAGNPQVAVIGAGHAGNGAVWFDETLAKWNVPSYYGAAPAVISNRNRTSPTTTKIASTVWRPLYANEHYASGKAWNAGNFSYSFSGATRDAYTRFKNSAPFNAEVTDVAIDLLKSMQSAATEAQPGMLSVAYSVAPIGFDYDDDNRPELVDSYVRLDAEIGRLIDAIEKDYGAGNVLIFLSSTGYADEPAMPDGAAKLPSGEITLKKAESLLNAYLSASFGNGDYVLLIKDGKLFLDRKEAEKHGIDINRLRAEAKSFLLRMGGISEIFTIDEVMNSTNRRGESLALGIDPKNSPDLLLFFTPGWTVTDDNAYPEVSQKVRAASPSTPAFILAPDLKPQTITYTVDATALAPTIASTLRIRSPNGAASKPVYLERK